jgi:hypothetical protein
MHMSTRNTPKQQAHELIDALPDDATWADVAYRMEVRADIEEALAEMDAGRGISTAELRREFNLPE